MSGKKTRLARFGADGTKRAGIIVPIDHGLTIGPMPGLASTREIATWIKSDAIDGVVAHKGLVERLGERGLLGGKGVMVHLNGMSTLGKAPDTKVRLTDIETAIRLGADAVSLQVNFDGGNDAENLAALGSVVDDAMRFGLPVLAMVYDKVPTADANRRIARARHLMRIAIELGVDALKIGAPADVEEIPALLEGIASDAPVYFAGGALGSTDELFALARAAVDHGGAGLCVGRNVFQQARPGELLASLRDVLDAPRPDGKATRLAAVRPLSSRQLHAGTP